LSQQKAKTNYTSKTHFRKFRKNKDLNKKKMVKKKANQLGRILIKDRFGQNNRRKVNNDTMVSYLQEKQDFLFFLSNPKLSIAKAGERLEILIRKNVPFK
jgi:hypothetical protein